MAAHSPARNATGVESHPVRRASSRAHEVTLLPASLRPSPSVGSLKSLEKSGTASAPISSRSSSAAAPRICRGRVAPSSSCGGISAVGGLPRAPHQRSPMKELRAVARECDARFSGDRTPLQKAMSDVAVRRNKHFEEKFAKATHDTNAASPKSAAANPYRRATVLPGESLTEAISEVDALLRTIKEGKHADTADKGEEEARPEIDRRRSELELRVNERDAKRSVQMKLAVARIDQGSAQEQPCAPIPMIKLKSRPGEEVDIVDISAVRTRCIQLQDGVNVRSLMDFKLEKEAQQRRMHEGTVSAPSCYGASMRSRCPSTIGSEHSFLAPIGAKSLEKRRKLQSVRATKDAHHFDRMLRHLSTMRGDPSEIAFERFEALARTVVPNDEEGDMPARLQTLGQEPTTRGLPFLQSSRSMPAKDFALTQEIAIGLGQSLVSRVTTPPQVRAAKRSQANTEALLSTKVDSRSLQARRSRMKAKRGMFRLRIKRLWRKLVGFTRVLMAFLGHLLRYRSAEVAKNFYSQMGEYTRIKSAIHRLRKSVRVIQRACRAYLAIKASRLEQMAQYWQVVEDYHLQEYFRDFLQQLVIEKTSGASKRYSSPWSQEIVDKVLGGSSDSVSFDWQKLRIPLAERDALLERYYAVSRDNLLQREYDTEERCEMLVQQVHCFVDLTKMGVDVDAELGDHAEVEEEPEEAPEEAPKEPPKPAIRDSGQAGHKEKHAQASPHVSRRRGARRRLSAVPPPISRFWQVDEDTVLDMIFVVASSLKSAAPFMYHPGNMDPGPHNPMNRRLSEGNGSRAYLMKNKAQRKPARQPTSAKEVVVEPPAELEDAGVRDDQLSRVLEGFAFEPGMTSRIPVDAPSGSGFSTPVFIQLEYLPKEP